MTIFIGLMGPSGSGKNEVSKVIANLAQKHGQSTDVVGSSEILKKLLDQKGVPKHPRGRQVYQDLVRDTEAISPGFLSHEVGKMLLASTADIRIFDGMRLPSDLCMMRGLESSLIIGISAKREKRYQWLRNRGQRSDETNMTWGEFLEQEAAYTESFLSKLLPQADLMIFNTATKNFLATQVASIFRLQILPLLTQEALVT